MACLRARVPSIIIHRFSGIMEANKKQERSRSDKPPKKPSGDETDTRANNKSERFDSNKQNRNQRNKLNSPTKSNIKDDRPDDHNFGWGERQPIDEIAFEEFMNDIKRSRSRYFTSEFKVHEKRYRSINGLTASTKGNYRGVCYWMFRDQRVDDNWALITAQQFALQHKCPLYVTFYLMSHYSVAGTRQYDFMLRGLEQVEKQCRELGIQFHLKFGYAKDKIVDYCLDNKIDFVVADFMPLRDPLSWVDEAARKLLRVNIPLYQVDAHNIIPVWVTSNKMEIGAYTIRPKVHQNLREYLTEFPTLEKHPHQPEVVPEPVDWDKAWDHLKIDETVKPVTWAKPGTANAYRMLYEFITQRLRRYGEDRNMPTTNGISCLSPYYHFGQLSTQRTALCLSDDQIKVMGGPGVEAHMEQLIVRRELSDNYCFYQPNYDNYEGAFDWAKKTLEDHLDDKRDHIYTLEDFQYAKTHDRLWNATQIQMVKEGKMHGYMRMYWAKKIMEWTPNAAEALRIACFLNDKYELDGRDPNGYVGIMWSIVGVHDRMFVERPVIGKVRFMGYRGCTQKFDVDRYCRAYNRL